jgi:uncharacterized protein involved in response to NO
MIYALFPFYMFGFLMTTYPRWMAGIPVAKLHYLSSASLMGMGVTIAYLGLVTSKRLLIFGLAVYAIGWAFGLYSLLRVYVGAQRPDTLHALITTGVLLLGWGLLLTFILGICNSNQNLIAIARSGGIWWFLFPTFFSVSHRLIPFFSSAVLPDYKLIRPDWTLWLMTAGGLAHGALEICNLPAWTWMVDFPMAATALWLTIAWRIKQSFHVRILAMLHIAFVWLGLALLLYGMQSLSIMANADLHLLRAPLHALMVGYFAAMLIAMATRVTLGHSGSALTADNMAWTIFITIQTAALTRVMADLPVISTFASHLYLCSALLWLLAFGAWLLKFAPIYWRSTPDL